jgi:hypothetical protein
LQRQFQQLLPLGWLGRAYQFLPQLVTAVLPKVFDFEAYDATKAVRQEDGAWGFFGVSSGRKIGRLIVIEWLVVWDLMGLMDFELGFTGIQ